MAFNIDDKHNANRSKVCIMCYRKGTRNLSARDIEAIQEYVVDKYDINNPDFPAAICNGCYLLLSKKRNGHDVKLPDMIEDYNPQRPINLRSNSECSCRICTVARMDLQDAMKLKRHPGRPSQQTSAQIKNPRIKICSNCFTKLYPGCSHSTELCLSRRNKVYNVEKLLDSPTTKQRFASRTINTAGTSLATLGRHNRECSSTSKSQSTISLSTMSTIKQDLNLSTRKTLRLAHDIRITTKSRNAVESGLKEKLVETNHTLEEYFELKEIEFVHKANNKIINKKKRWTVICKNINSFINNIIYCRKFSNEPMIKIGIDGGGGFVKICLSIFELDTSVKDNGARRKRSYGSEEPLNKFKHSGVKKVFLLGIAPMVEENYENMQRLWLTIGCHKIDKPYTIATDLKLTNILVGIMAHGSTHPCCWCNISKCHLDEKGETRTFQSLKDSFWKYFEDGRVRKNAKNFDNVIHPSIVDVGEDNCPILNIIPPPELHLLTGPVNTLYKGLQKIWPDCDKWLVKCNVQREALHGGSFTGNSSRKLLKNVSFLKSICPISCLPYVSAFHSLNNIVESCYGSTLNPDFEKDILTFKQHFLALKINVTPKIHAIFYHITEFCKLKEQGLSPWSEQTTESIHHDFEEVWKNYKVNNVDHPDYGNRLKKAVVMYNSTHI